MRRLISFPCAGETLFGSLDDAEGATGLLIVSGGNEIRAGAHRGMALLAARLAADGIPVFRFDRRGIGDSSGVNNGFAGLRPDLKAAITTFRQAAPHVKRVVAFGNCDAASALLLFDVGFYRLVLANPWLGDDGDGMPSVDAIRARYADRLKDPKTWARALTGGVDFHKLMNGLKKLAANGSEDHADLEQQLIEAWRRLPETTVLIASGDVTGITFAAAAERAGLADRLQFIDTDSHSFAREADQEKLIEALRAAVVAA